MAGLLLVDWVSVFSTGISWYRNRVSTMAVHFHVGCSILALFLIALTVHGDGCQNPQVTSNAYTTTDATVVSNIAFIAEFSILCANNVQNFNLYADVNGKTMPVVKSPDGSKYQVSWTVEPSKAYKGNYPVRVFDEDGYSALRKAQRINEDVSAVPSLFTVDVYHYGTYKGPWFPSEIFAVIAAIGVYSLAYFTKSQLQS